LEDTYHSPKSLTEHLYEILTSNIKYNKETNLDKINQHPAMQNYKIKSRRLSAMVEQSILEAIQDYEDWQNSYY
jgi:hypothetical protein